MVGSGLRDREDIALDLVGVVGLTALAAGLVALAPSTEFGFDVAAAVEGVAGQLPVTLPAAALVLVVTAVELTAGFTVARLARRAPFSSLGEAVLWAVVGTLLKDVVLLGILGGIGLFRAPVLWLVDAALVVPVAVQLTRRARSREPGRRPGPGWRDWPTRIGSLPIAGLVVVVWSGPVMLMLASPVVPFVDVLPNHVAPAEHLRAFGSFDPLTATQSPIYGPSRSLLGYVGWLGALTTMSGLPAALAISAFILPSLVLVAAGLHRLARALEGPGLPLWPWILLAFAMTTSFARLADGRGTVVVLPFVCAAFALLADRERLAGRPDAWWPGTGTVAGLALGAAVLVHPVIGALAVATVGFVTLVRRTTLAADGTIACVVASVLALPQGATMAGLALPAVTLALTVVVAVGAGAALTGILRRERAQLLLDAILRRLPIVLVALAGAGVVLVLLTIPDAIRGAGPDAVQSAVGLSFEAVQVLLIVLVAGWVLGSGAARSAIVLVAAAVGITAAVVTQLIPDDTGLLGKALRFELPKTLYYWIPVAIAVGAGGTLAVLRVGPRLPWAGRAIILGLFVIVAAMPLRADPIDAFHLGERRWSEALAWDLRTAGAGFWRGYPDTRTVLDEPRRELVAAVQAEIEAGRLGPGTAVLHVARTFQQWDATPLGVFAGVNETDVSPDAEFSIHTIGGRLHLLDDLDGLLDSGAFGYVLLEPSVDLPPDVRARIEAAGFESTFVNGRGELFIAGP